MTVESVYAALPQTESEHRRDGSEFFAVRFLRRTLTYAVATVAAACTVVLLAFVPVYRSSASVSSSRFHDQGDLLPPILVVKPEMKRLHYCGLDPDDPKSMPRIPPFPDPEYKLVQVQAFIRHGARFINAPSKCWPGQEHVIYNCSLSEVATTDHDLLQNAAPVSRLYRKRFMDNRNFFKGNCQLGQLTVKGHRQEVALGAMFRDTYVGGLLGNEFDSDQVFVRAHDIPRTIMSAQAFISGMFPEHGSSDGRVPIVDIWSMDSNDEDEIINPHECPGVDQQRKDARASKDYIQHEITVTAQLNEKLSSVVGLPVDELGTNKFDCMFVSLCQGDPVPAGVDMDLIRALENEAVYNLYYLMQFPDRTRGSRLTIGPLLREILDQMKTVESSPRFSLYSGHDSGPIMLLLSAFGVEDKHWSPFASYISLELYQRKDEFFVRFVYNGDVRQMPFCDGNDLTPLHVLEDYLKLILPTPEECPPIRRFIS